MESTTEGDRSNESMDQFSVFDSNQAQTLGRSRGPRQGAVSGPENSEDATWFQLPSPHLYERAHDVADHVVKKPITGNLVDQHGGLGAAENSGSEYASHHGSFDSGCSGLASASTVRARPVYVADGALATLFRSGPIHCREACEIVFPFK